LHYFNLIQVANQKVRFQIKCEIIADLIIML
jgi:hypothetical protein